VLYELTTGRGPFQGFSSLYSVLKAISSGDCAPPSAQRADLDPTLERIIQRAMAVRPTERFGSMRELGHALLDFADTATRTHWSPFFEPYDEAATQPSVAPPPRLDDGSESHDETGPNAQRHPHAASSGTPLPVPARSPASAGHRTDRGAPVSTERSPEVPTPHASARSVRSRDAPLSDPPDATPPRWLSWAPLLVLAVLGVGALYSSQRSNAPISVDERVHALEGAAPAEAAAPAAVDPSAPTARSEERGPDAPPASAPLPRDTELTGSAEPGTPPDAEPRRQSTGAAPQVERGARATGQRPPAPRASPPGAKDAPDDALDPERRALRDRPGELSPAAPLEGDGAAATGEAGSGAAETGAAETGAAETGATAPRLRLEDNLDPWQ
jgi:serine/threonine-protein kinase